MATHRDPDTGAVRITPGGNGDGNGGKRPFISIDRETRILVPLGALAALVYLIWSVAGAWKEQSLEVTRLRADLTAHVADNVEDFKVTDIRLRKLEGSLLGQQPQQGGSTNGPVRSVQRAAVLRDGNGDDPYGFTARPKRACGRRPRTSPPGRRCSTSSPAKPRR